MNFSYNYSDLIREIESDILEGLIDPRDPILIVRDKNPAFKNYKPIIDYYYKDNEAKELTEVVPVKKVLEEMKEYNSIILKNNS